MPKFRKKPVVIEAVQFTGKNTDEILKFVNIGDDRVAFVSSYGLDGYDKLTIKTLEGRMLAESGDWIIRGVKGEFYPCKPDIFEATYEKA